MLSRSLQLVFLWLTVAASTPGQTPEPPTDDAPRPWRLSGPAHEARVDAAAAWAAREPAWRAAHEKALAWLVRNQHPDGSWAAEANDRNLPKAPARTVATTAIAVLALESGLSTLRTGPQREPIRRAILWLREKQRDDGWFVDPTDTDATLAQALAATTMTRTCFESGYQLLRDSAQRGSKVFGDTTRLPGTEQWSALPAALVLCGVRGLPAGTLPELDALQAHVSRLLLATGIADTGHGPTYEGALPGTQEMASLATVMALSGAATPANDPRLAAAATRATAMTRRFGRDGELLDATTLWLGTDVAFTLEGPARAAWQELVKTTVLARPSDAGEHADSFAYPCGLTLLRNRTAETAMTALALAAPWFRVGR